MFCQLFPPLIYGGGEILLWNLARSLVSQGHEVTVITQRVRGGKDSENRSGVRILRVGRPADYEGALTTSFVDSLAYLFEATVVAARHIRHTHVDLIHSNTYVPALAGQVCSWIFRKKHVITVHDVYLLTMSWFWRKWSRQPGVSALARYFGSILELILLHLPATAIHTVSQTSKADLIKAGTQQRIEVVPNGLETNDYSVPDGVRSNPHQAIFVGRLVFYKNLEVVFRALPKVIRRVPDARLVIVGDGVMKEAWERMVEKLGLQEHVEFRGRVPHEDKVRLLHESAFLVLPSLVEGFGIVVLEAFACGKAVLASSIGALKELVDDGTNGCILGPFSVDQWAEKMSRLFLDHKLACTMGAKAERTLLKEYTTKHVTEAMVRLYESVLTTY